MTLETLTPTSDFDPSPHSDAIQTFADHADRLTIRVWGGDWCDDCRRVLPDFASALAAADIDTEQLEVYPVEKNAAGQKVGPNMTEFGVEYIPTIIIELDGTEIVRFVESESDPAIDYLAAQLTDHLLKADS